MTQTTRTADLLDVLARVADGVYAVDSQQRIILWNQGAQDLLGYTSEEVLGKRCDEVLGGHNEEGSLTCRRNCFILQLARRGMVVPSQTLRVPTRRGETRWVSITHVTVPSERAELDAIAHLFRDVTPDVEANRLLHRLATLLASSGRRNGQERFAGAPLEEETPLTIREREVLSLLARGHGTRAIAWQLAISETTTRNHIQNILSKLGVHTRLEAVAYAVQHRLIR